MIRLQSYWANKNPEKFPESKLVTFCKKYNRLEIFENLLSCSMYFCNKHPQYTRMSAYPCPSQISDSEGYL